MSMSIDDSKVRLGLKLDYLNTCASITLILPLAKILEYRRSSSVGLPLDRFRFLAVESPNLSLIGSGATGSS